MLSDLQQIPLPYAIAISSIIGLVVGSFLNVVIYRVPAMMFRSWEEECEEYIQSKHNKDQKTEAEPQKKEVFNLVLPASRCPNCNTGIKPWHNIPVISYVFLKGACAYCSKKISLRYPSIEATTAILSGLLIALLGITPQAMLGLLLLWSLICLTMIDIDHQLLPDSITLPLLWLGLIANLYGTYTSLNEAVIGAIAGYLSLWSVYWAFKLLTGKEGMGFGDFKLLAALGAWMGWQMLPLIIVLSSLVGTVCAVAGILIAGKDKAKPIPFGPYLAIAGLIAFLWGDAIVSWYLSSSGV